jgi:lipopolysaccharide export system protein LptA
MKNTIQISTKHKRTQSAVVKCTIHTRTVKAIGTRLTVLACMVVALTSAQGVLLSKAYAAKNTPRYGVSAAVLPFEVFSIEKEPTLGTEVATAIARQLALNPSITCIDSQKIQTVMQPDDYVSMTKERLQQMAKLLNANCIIMGTITKIRSEHSIDVEMFTAASAGPAFKTFAEGLEIQSLVETIVNTLDQEIMKKSDGIPSAERPQVSAGRQSSKSTPAGGYDVDRELLAAFGPVQEEPTPGPAPAAEPAGAVKDVPSAVVAEAVDTAAAPVDAPAAQPSTPVPGSSDQKTAAQNRKGKKYSDKIKKDSSFFSLSKAISINSDTMEYDNRANMAIFKGNVVARQDDISMFANTMQVFYSESGGLSRVEATGDVRVVQGDRIATGSSIIFDNAAQTIVATGNPRVWQGDNVVHGRKITVYLREERTVVDSEPNSRASATIYPDSDKKRP